VASPAFVRRRDSLRFSLRNLLLLVLVPCLVQPVSRHVRDFAVVVVWPLTFHSLELHSSRQLRRRGLKKLRIYKADRVRCLLQADDLPSPGNAAQGPSSSRAES